MDKGTKFDVARDILLDYLKELKDKPLNIAIRVYGSKGGACEDTEFIFPFTKAKDINFDDLTKILQGLEPIGQNTLIAYSLTKAEGDFINKEGENNWIVLLTDGLETCRGDPCKVAEELFVSSARIKVHTVGIKIDEKGLANLNCIVAPSGGLLFNAENADELLSSLKEVVEAAYRYNLRLATVDKNGKSIRRRYSWNCPTGAPCCLAYMNVPGWNILKFAPGHYTFKIRNLKTGEVKNVEVDLCEDKMKEVVVTFDEGEIREYVYEPYSMVHINAIDDKHGTPNFVILMCINGKFARDKLDEKWSDFCKECSSYRWWTVAQFVEYIAPPGTHEFCVYNKKSGEAKYFTLEVEAGKIYTKDITF